MTRIISYFILQTLPIFQIFQGSNGFFSDAVLRLRYSKVAISTTSTSIAAKQRSATRIKTTAFDDHRPRLFILIPAYNEESRIASTLECYQNFLMDPFNDLSSLFQTCKIIIVDDGSTVNPLDAAGKQEEDDGDSHGVMRNRLVQRVRRHRRESTQQQKVDLR